MNIKNINIEKFNEPYRFNIVNMNNEELVKLGLEPLYLIAYPQYINLEGNIFYGGNLHYECDLSNDIESILHVMNSNVYDREKNIYGFLSDNYRICFQIYNHQIFFSDSMSLSVYKNNSIIKNMVNKKFNLSEEFYEPTVEEIYQDYGWEYFMRVRKKYGDNYEYYHLNLTPHEYFKMMISSKQRTLRPYTNPNELTGYDLRNWLNYNANIFFDCKCSRDITGAYNQEVMEFINSLLETKLDIYNCFNQLAKQSKEWKKTVKELLISLGVYSEYIKKELTCEEVFDNLGAFDERNHWDIMFNRASHDMLVQFVGFDKIETQLSKTITTSKTNIYDEFFNLLIMEYNIVQIPKLIFDEEMQHFRWIYPNEFINSGVNRECEEDIKLIKKYVPYNERYKYFK